MAYDFSFDKKSIALLASCGLVSGVLLVSAGFLLGIRRVNPGPVVNTPHLPASFQAVPPQTAPSQGTAPSTAKPEAAAVTSDSKPTPSTSLGSPASTRNAHIPERPQSIHDHRSGFCLQFGAFQDKIKADAKVKSLKEAGIAAELFTTRDATGRSWFTVRSGSFAALPEASEAASAVADKTGDYVIVRYRNQF